MLAKSVLRPPQAFQAGFICLLLINLRCLSLMAVDQVVEMVHYYNSKW